MAKAAIRELKDRRFWRWLCVEIYGKPAPKQPIKRYRKHVRINPRKFKRLCDDAFHRVLEKIERRVAETN